MAWVDAPTQTQAPAQSGWQDVDSGTTDFVPHGRIPPSSESTDPGGSLATSVVPDLLNAAAKPIADAMDPEGTPAKVVKGIATNPPSVIQMIHTAGAGGRILEGKEDPNSPEGQDDALNVGMMAAFGAKPLVGKAIAPMEDQMGEAFGPPQPPTPPPEASAPPPGSSPARISADIVQKKLFGEGGVDPRKIAQRLAANEPKGLPLVALDEVQRDELNDPTSGDNILSMVAAAGNKPGLAQQLSRGLVRRGDMQRQQFSSQLDDSLSSDSAYKLHDESLMQLAKEGKAAQDAAFAQGKDGEPITSDRLQEIIKDPLVMNGIKYGIRTQQIRSLGNPLEPFDPYDYDVKGTDPNGDMIIGQYPGMRALDAGRKGLGSMIDQEVASNGGRFNERAAAMAEAKSNLTDELTRLNPAYATYLKTAGEPLANQQAMENGRNFMSFRPEELNDMVNGNKERFLSGLSPKLHDPMSDGGKAFLKAGIRDTVADKLSNNQDDAAVVDKLWKQNVRDRLAPVVGPAGMEQLASHVQDQRAMMRSNRAFGGSNTFDKFAANAALQDATVTPTAAHAAKAFRFVGNPVRASANMASDFLGDMAKAHTNKMTNETAAELMQDYTSRDPKVWYDLADRLDKIK